MKDGYLELVLFILFIYLFISKCPVLAIDFNLEKDGDVGEEDLL